MNSVAYRSVLLSLLMITSALAGCLGDTGDDADVVDPVVVDPITSFGTVMVSTYHVGELVKAVAGDHVELEYMSQDNIPVHDYEPSAADLIRLQEVDVFFYHGLNLEPWVESTLESLGADAPPSFMTHTMLAGEETLDYQSLLVADLCELMSDGPFVSTTLATMSEDHDEHDEHDEHDDNDGGMQTAAGHGDHSDDDDDHDGHDDHDDHDDHEGHGHATAEKVIQNPETCPADTTIQVFHMEEGEHVIEFESEHGEEFNMAVLKMLGGHAHHHHDHGDDHDDHSDEEDDHDDHSDEEDDHDDHSDEIEADEGEEAFDYDPHSWLDPLSFNEQLKLVQDKLTMTFPDGTDAFAENTEAYSALLTQLHDSFEAALGDDGTCVTGGFDKTIVANHNAYSYISVRYNIDILTVHGLDPEGEPSPAEVAEVVEHIKEEGITVLFVEEYTDQSAVQSIVEETDVEVQILYTMELRPSDDTDDYLSMMNKNIGNIVSGIGC